MNKPTFFKLPLLFITVYFLSQFIQVILHTVDIYHRYGYNGSTEWTYTITGYLLRLAFPLFFYYILAVFYCNRYRLHKWKNSPGILLIAILFSLFSFAWSRISSLFVVTIFNYLSLTPSTNPLFGLLTTGITLSVGYLVHAYILSCLFRFFASSTTAQREPAKLDLISGQKVYALLYSLTMIAWSVLLLSFTSFSLSVNIYTYFNLEESTLLLYLIPFFLFMLMIYDLLFRSATIGCFKRFDATLQKGQLLKSVGLTILFITINSLVLGTLLLFIMQRPLIAYYYSDVVTPELITVAIMGFILSYLIIFFSARLAVKLVFAPKKQKSSISSNFIH